MLDLEVNFFRWRLLFKAVHPLLKQQYFTQLSRGRSVACPKRARCDLRQHLGHSSVAIKIQYIDSSGNILEKKIMRLLRQNRSNSSSQPMPSSPEPQQSTPNMGRIRRHRTDSDVPPPPSGTPGRMVPSSPAARPILRSASDDPVDPSNRDMLPTAWIVDDSSLRHPDPLCFTCNASPKTSVYANRTLPIEILGRNNSPGKQGSWRGRTNPNAASTPQIYYFEVTLTGTGASLDAAIGLACDRDSFGSWPGETPNSIGWGSDGLFVNGVLVEGIGGIHFKQGDVLGCGMEIGGMKRVFFTYNTTLMIPPNASTAFLGTGDRNCLPVMAFRYGNSRHVVKANFGMDATAPFRWKSTQGMSILTQQPGGSSYSHASFDSLPAYQQDPMEISRRSSARGSSRSRSPSPYYSISEMPSSPTRDPIQTRSASYAIGGEKITPDTVSPRYNVTTGSGPGTTSRQPLYNSSSSRHQPQHQPQPPVISAPHTEHPGGSPQPQGFYGTRNNRRTDLTDDDPAAALQSEHLTIPTKHDAQHNTAAHAAANNSALSNSEHRRQQHRASRAARRTRSSRGQSPSAMTGQSPPGRLGVSSSHTSSPTSGISQGNITSSPLTAGIPSGNMNHSSLMAMAPAHSVSFNDGSNSTRHNQLSTDSTEPMLQRSDSVLKREEEPDERAFHPGAVPSSSPAQELFAEAKSHSQKLQQAAKESELNMDLVQEMLEACKKDQEALQLKLNHALEQSDSIENLEELFGVNDGICTAIEVGTAALKRAKEKKKKKKKVEGPTIELLVENEDVFSLICMLRAANEKRMEAALALMKFARDSDRLRNEIRSSGGMHSFLTLFRTNGIARELKVVAGLAVAYVVPNFVLSSQTSSSIGLKIIECLRFLVISNDTAVNGVAISKIEMCKAASVGVTFLWINSIQPLLITSINQGEKAVGRKRHSLARFGRPRSRIGGGTFDQGQEALEVKELSELAVALIVQLANMLETGKLRGMEFGYNIVEQVCEVDAARPIAVREGLMRLLVDWITSKNVDKVRPAASALRYLISIKDKYMAGWIHSQVVNEGAVAEIVKLLNESVGHDVRVAVAEMLSALCCAPHTRAAVVEANCVSYLVALLYEHSSPASEQMVHYAGSALLQLAAGALTRASALAGNNMVVESHGPNKRDTVVK